MRSHRHTNRTHPANGPAGSLLAGLIFHPGRGREGMKPTGPLLRESIIDRQGEREIGMRGGKKKEVGIRLQAYCGSSRAA